MRIVRTADSEAYRRMTTSELRSRFLVENLFEAGRSNLVYTDVDRAVVFLASPAAAYVNGSILAVDGGWLAR